MKSSSSSSDGHDYGQGMGLTPSIGPGFHNYGNTCFMNASLQILLHTRPFADLITLHHDKVGKGKCTLKRGCVLCLLYRLLPMRASSRQARHALPKRTTAGRLLSLSLNIPSLDHFHMQQDASQFLEQLLQHLHAQINPTIQLRKKKRAMRNPFSGVRLDAVICPHCTFQDGKPYIESPAMIRLPFDHMESIESALRRYTAAEDLAGSEASRRRCDMCHMTGFATRRQLIVKPPEVLIIQLLRFEQKGRESVKNVNIMRCSSGLSLSVCMSSEASRKDSKPFYRLYGVINHRGSRSSQYGHYTAHIRAATGDWYLLDDSWRERISQKDVQRFILNNPDSFILFYQREL